MPASLIGISEKDQKGQFTAEDTPGLPGVSGAVPARGYRPRAGGRAQRGPLTSVSSFSQTNVLVFGMGSSAYGRERRAVTVLNQMHRVKPYFLTSQWEDGSVSRLLEEHHLEFEHTSFGYLGRAKPLWTLDNVLRWPSLYSAVIRAYLRRHCSIIVILNLSSFVNALPALLILRFLFKARLVFYLGDIPSENSFNRITAFLVNKLASRVIANSQAVKQSLTRLGINKPKTDVIYNGVDLRRFKNPLPYGFRKKYGWPPDSVLIGYVGQLLPNKGVWDFVKAAELVLRTEPNCRFLVIGKVDERKVYDRILLAEAKRMDLRKRLVFTGPMDEIENAYADLDILVVPSRHEDPAPNVVIEAMASGVPVIATRVGGNPELVADGKTGWLVEKGNPKAIAERILQLVENAELKKEMGQMARERTRQRFDIRKNANLLKGALLYDKI